MSGFDAFQWTEYTSRHKNPSGKYWYEKWQPILIKDVDSLCEPAIVGKYDVYRSIYDYTKPEHPSQHSEYVVGDLILEFDDDTSAEAAISDAVKIIDHFKANFGVSEDQWQITYSGNRGAKVRLPKEAFLKEPLPFFQRCINHLVKNGIKPIARTADDKIFGNRRQMRIDNTIHSGTGRFRVHLSYDEAKALPLKDVIELSKAQRFLSLPAPKFNPAVNKLFVELQNSILSSKRAELEIRKVRHEEFSKVDGDSLTLDTLPEPFKYFAKGSSKGGRYQTLFKLICALAQLNCSDEVIQDIIMEFNKRCRPPEELKELSKNANHILPYAEAYAKEVPCE